MCIEIYFIGENEKGRLRNSSYTYLVSIECPYYISYMCAMYLVSITMLY